MAENDNFVFCIIAILCALSLCCIIYIRHSNKDNSTCSLGNVVKIQEIPTSFNDVPRCSIETDKGFYIVKGLYSAEKGKNISVPCEKIVKE